MRNESMGASSVYTTGGAIMSELLYCSHGKNNSSRVSFVLPVIPNMGPYAPQGINTSKVVSDFESKRSNLG